DSCRQPERIGAPLARGHGRIGGAAGKVDDLGGRIFARIDVVLGLQGFLGQTHRQLHHFTSVGRTGVRPACASAAERAGRGSRTGPSLISVATSSPDRSTISRGTPSTTITSPRTAKLTGPSVP